jgi:glycosyltransferase involved in cell wall biosynthesis
MNTRSETIALLEWNWMGHHPTYFNHFAAAMAEAGAEVVPFCADAEDFAKRLAALDLSKDVADRIAPAERVEGPRPSNFRPARWRGIYEARKFFGGLGKQLRAWETKHGRKIDLVFFACIYDRQFEHFEHAERLFGFPWAGLYLHARSFRMPGSPVPYLGGVPCPERIFASPSLRAAAVLDEGAAKPLGKLTGGKPVLLFPDITVAALPDEGPAEGLAGKIKSFAAGRPMVSLTGHLQWTKGLDVFMQAAGHPDMQNVFFFLGGDVNWGEMSEEDKAKLQQGWERLPNVYAHLQHLPEPTMNSVYAVSDAVVAAYRAFPNSSNALTKAAVFERPIVVSDGYLMAERVRKFELGEVIPEGNAEALVAALRRMMAPGYLEELRGRARWKDYREAHSVGRLKNAMEELVAAL